MNKEVLTQDVDFYWSHITVHNGQSVVIREWLALFIHKITSPSGSLNKLTRITYRLDLAFPMFLYTTDLTTSKEYKVCVLAAARHQFSLIDFE